MMSNAFLVDMQALQCCARVERPNIDMLFHADCVLMLSMCAAVFVRPRTLVDAFAVSLLFSLPAFRNTMPGVPTVSTARATTVVAYQ